MRGVTLLTPILEALRHVRPKLVKCPGLQSSSCGGRQASRPKAKASFRTPERLRARKYKATSGQALPLERNRGSEHPPTYLEAVASKKVSEKYHALERTLPRLDSRRWTVTNVFDMSQLHTL